MASGDGALREFLKPFVARLGHKKRRQMCPLYVLGLIGPGERKSMQPMAERIDPARYDRFHHFISDGPWTEAPSGQNSPTRPAASWADPHLRVSAQPGV